MATRPSQSAADVLADGRNVLAAAKAQLPGFKKYDAGRKRKLFDPGILTRLAQNLAVAKKAGGAVAAGKAGVGTATADEVAAREKLLAAITAIRDDVRLAYPGDKAMGRAFGVGRKLSIDVTNPLLDAADAIVEAYEDKDNDFGERAKDAGVKPAQITALKRLRAALDTADATQGTKIGARKTASATKQSTLAAIKKDVARIRAVAKRVFKGNAKVLATFESRIARRTVQKRAPKPPTPAP